MASRWVRPWVAPLVTALGVGAIVLGLHAVVEGGQGGTGPGPDDDRATRVVEAPSMAAFEVNLSHQDAAITGYSVKGRRLTIAYDIRYPDCQLTVVHPALSETLESIVVQLQRVPIAAQSLVSCPARAVRHLVSVQMSRPLAYRTVLDGADERRQVPRLG